MSAVTLIDAGVECPGPLGGRWHYQIEIDGRTWRKGDVFYVLDRRGVPRPFKFMYHYTGNDTTVCYSQQRFRRADERWSTPPGFITMMPVDVAVSMSGTEMRIRQLAGDLLDVGREAAGLVLLEALDGDPDDLVEAERVARAALAAAEADDDDVAAWEAAS